jgi:hypothetical protein
MICTSYEGGGTVLNDTFCTNNKNLPFSLRENRIECKNLTSFILYLPNVAMFCEENYKLHFREFCKSFFFNLATEVQDENQLPLSLLLHLHEVLLPRLRHLVQYLPGQDA